LKNEIPDGLASISQKIIPLFTQIAKTFDSVFIGGFSQGAIVSADAIFSQPWHPQALLLFSTTFVAQNRLMPFLTQKKEMQIFQSHGTQDSILSIEAARELKQFFQTASLKIDYFEFQGGHEITPEVLKQCYQSLQKIGGDGGN